MTTQRNFDTITQTVARRSDSVTNAGKTKAKGFINDTIEEMAEQRDWSFFRIRSSALTMVAAQYDYSLPTTFSRVDKVFYKSSDGQPVGLDPLTDDNWFDTINEEDPGTPRYHRYLDQESTTMRPKLQIGPPPSASFISRYGSYLYAEVYKEVTTLVEPESYPDFPARFHKVIEWGAASAMCLDQGDQVKADRFYGKYMGLLDRLILLDKNRFIRQLTIPVQPSSTIYPQRCRTNLGMASDYGE